MSFNLLVLHSDRSTGINFVQCLQKAKKEGWGQDINIVGACTHPIRMHLCKNDLTFFVDEKIERDPVVLTQRIEEELGQAINLIYETKSASYMLTVSKARKEIPLFLPPHEMVEAFEDKFRTFQHLQERGLPVPKTFLINKPEDVDFAFSQIDRKDVWVRDTQGQAGQGSFASNSPEVVKRELTKKRGWGYCMVAEKLPINTENDWRNRLSSDFFPGEMITWIGLYNKGQMVAGQVRKRLYWEHADLTTSGITGYSGANMTIDRPDVHNLCDKIMRSFDRKPHGAVGADFVVDYDRSIKLTEIQASRFFTSTYPLAMLGMNLPKMYIDIYRKNSITYGQVNPCPEGYIYIQRFGSESLLIHRDKILKDMKTGVVKPAEHNNPTDAMVFT